MRHLFNHKTTTMMNNNNLFLVCPFSSVEPFIRSKYGNDNYFLTAPAGYFKFEEEPYLQEVRNFIARNRPNNIYIVHDTACRFLQGVVSGREEQPEVEACKPIQEIFQRNIQDIMQAPEPEAKVEKLAEYSMVQQTTHWVQPQVLGREIMGYGIQIKGLITNRQKQACKEVDINLAMD